MIFRLAPVLAVALLSAACERLSREENRTIQRWLLCEECLEGERDSVVRMGDRAVRTLSRALQGPSESGIRNIRMQAEDIYRRTAQVLNRQNFVEHYVANYQATYQSRAAIALGDIGTARAHTALIDAVREDLGYREDVLRILGASAAVVVSIVAGDSQHAPLDSVVRQDPTILVRDAMNGQPLSNVRVVFDVDSGGGSVSPSVRQTAVNGTALTSWTLGSSDSINIMRAVAAGQTARFRAFAHPHGRRVVFLVQPSNAKRGQPIAPPVRVAIQDAWARTDTGFNGASQVRIACPGTEANYFFNFVAGVANMPTLRLLGPRSGCVLLVRVAGVGGADSEPFDITP